MRSDEYWRAIEDQYHRTHERDPYNGGHGPAATLDNPAGFRAYMVMARYSPNHTLHKITDLYGRERWLNDKGWRVMALALLTIASNTQTSLTVMAEKIGCHRQTVSRWITKLTAWGVIGSGTVRGRYGGLVLFARSVRDNLEHWAQVARAKIHARKGRDSKCAPPTEGGVSRSSMTPNYLSMSKGAHLDLADALGLDRARGKGSIKCPAHEDKRASLSWKFTEGGKLLLHCFAGCTFAEVRGAIS